MKKIFSLLFTNALVLMLVGSIMSQIVLANHTDHEFVFSFNESVGDYLQYTKVRPKEDATSGWVRSDEKNIYGFRAALAGYYDGEYIENFGPYGGLKWITVRPGYGYYLPNYVYEYKQYMNYSEIYAAVKGESTVGVAYTVIVKWSPDSI